MKRTTKITALSIFLLVILMIKVNAFGVSSPYWDDNPLLLYPGDNKNVTMVLQNMVGEYDITVIGELTGGKEIARITDESTTYKVPIGRSNIPVNLEIRVPENAKSGSEWAIGVSFKTVSENTGGLALGTGVVKGFKVKVIEQPAVSSQASKQNLNFQPIYGLVLGIVILLVLFFIWRKYHKL